MLLGLAVFLLPGASVKGQQTNELSAALREVADNVTPPQLVKSDPLRELLGKDVRARRDAANRRETGGRPPARYRAVPGAPVILVVESCASRECESGRDPRRSIESELGTNTSGWIRQGGVPCACP